MQRPCWISPEGKIFEVEWQGHGDFAKQVLNRPDLYREVATEKLAKMGWLHIGQCEYISAVPYSKLPEPQACAFHQVLKNTDGLRKQYLLGYLHGG